MTVTVDAVVIGSGHNGLVAAAYLAKGGWSTHVLERNEEPGGSVATEELTEPGFRHDTFSAWHPLFRLSAAWADLGEELEARGLSYSETPDATTATAAADGRVAIAYRDPERTAAAFPAADRARYLAELDAFGGRIDLVGQLLATDLYSPAAARLVLRLARKLGRRETLVFTADVIGSARRWFETRFEDPCLSDLYAPWALHTGLSPDAAGGGFSALAIAASLHAAGLPVVTGGSDGFPRAFTRLIQDHGGTVTVGTEVARILVERGRAVGVRTTAGEEIRARRAVIANVTPAQLYGHLLADGDAPAPLLEAGRRFRYGRRAGMQLHVALSTPLSWRDGRLDGVPIVHLADGIDEIALACAQASAGLLPANPTVVVGQPTVVDPSRAPTGRGIVWIQLQEVPYRPAGDAAGEIDVGGDGWTPDVIEAYTARVLAKLKAQVRNWGDAYRCHVALSPPELERRNPNLVRGDIYAGDCELAQSYLWRPLPGRSSHRVAVRGLYQCGASTYPGPGLNAASGRIVARGLLRGRRAWRR